MKVCILSPHSRPAGGVKVLLDLATGLHAAGHVVKLLFYKFDSIDWYDSAVSCQISQSSFITKRDLAGCDVMINFCDGTAFGPFGGIPQILYLQGFGSQDYSRECINLMYKYTAVVATSRWLAELAASMGHNVTIIPPAIESYFEHAAMPKMDNKRVIGVLYHTATTKNFRLIIKTIQKMGDSAKEFFFVMLASKEPEKEHEEFFKNTAQHKFFVNPKRKAIPRIYSLADVWLCPSLLEGFGLPPLEAMACQTPVVTVPSLGLDDVLVNRSNCVIVNNSAGEMHNATIEVLKDVQLRKELIRNGLRLSKQYTMERFITSFIGVLNSIK
jgi:glycosyltransferase involved in cell wall biosynthesis